MAKPTKAQLRQRKIIKAPKVHLAIDWAAYALIDYGMKSSKFTVSNAKKANLKGKLGLNNEVIELFAPEIKKQMIHSAKGGRAKPTARMYPKLRSVQVTYSNGTKISTSMAANLSDQQIKNYFKVGKYFNVGSGSKDVMAKVKSVKILF